MSTSSVKSVIRHYDLFACPRSNTLRCRKVRKNVRARRELKSGAMGITDFTDLTDAVSIPTADIETEAPMRIRLIRRVEGRRGSVSLYRYRDGLAEVVKVTEEGTELIELRRHDLRFEPELLAYLAAVQVGIDGLDTKTQAKRKRRLKVTSLRRHVLRVGDMAVSRSNHSLSFRFVKRRIAPDKKRVTRRSRLAVPT